MLTRCKGLFAPYTHICGDVGHYMRLYNATVALLVPDENLRTTADSILEHVNEALCGSFREERREDLARTARFHVAEVLFQGFGQSGRNAALDDHPLSRHTYLTGVHQCRRCDGSCSSLDIRVFQNLPRSVKLIARYAPLWGLPLRGISLPVQTRRA